MGAILNLNYRYVNSAGSDVVGWPNPVMVPGTTLWPYQRMTQLIPEIAAAGFSAILLPPSTEGAAGAWSGGYDKYDDYGIDNTAFGTGEMLRQLIAVAHAHGLQAYGDLVLHQYDGGKACIYPTRRFPKSPSCFSGVPGGEPADPVPDEQGNYAFGNLADYTQGRFKPTDPPGYMHDGAVAASQWLARTAGFDGFRIDDSKGTNAQIVYDVTHAEYMSGLEIIYEYFDGNPNAVSNYEFGYERGRGTMLDFAFKFNSGNICNNSSKVWMGQCAALGWCDSDPYAAVTWCESADTDTTQGQQTIFNKIEQYALMFTRQGYPEVYYRDWSTDPMCYGMKAEINNLLWCHEKLAQGDYVVRLDTDGQVFACERMGYGDAPGCVFVLNNDMYNEYTRTLPNHFGPGRAMHEYSGNGPYNDIHNAGDGSLTVTTPKNDNGRGYLIYAPDGVEGAISYPPIRTTQTFFNAADLKSGAVSDGIVVVGTIFCAEGTTLDLSLVFDSSAFGVDVDMTIQVSQSDGQMLPLDLNGLSEGAWQITTTGSATVQMSGPHTLMLACSGLPTSGCATELTATYTGVAA